MRACLLAGLLLLILSCALAQDGAAVKVLADFEDGKAWPGTRLTTDTVKGGKSALVWSNLPQKTSLPIAGVPTDWTPYDRLNFWLHSEKANGQKLTVLAVSENPANGAQEWDYYYHHLEVDWTGWKLITLRRGQELQASRRPLGWDHIQSLSLSASGWENRPLEDTVMVIDDITLSRDRLKVEALPPVVTTQPVQATHTVRLTSRDKEPVSVKLSLDAGALKHFAAKLSREQITLAKFGETAEVTLTLRLKAGTQAPPLQTETVTVLAEPGGAEAPQSLSLSAAIPLPPRPHPRLFLTAAEIAAAKERAAEYPWADQQLKSLIAQGESALRLNVAEVPDRGGQWGHYYVCKACGVSLTRVDNTHHQCGKCKQVYTGWPWDDVVVANIHSGFTGGVQRLGLAYAFTGDEKYAQKAREILLAYADKYPTLKLHDISGGEARSGGRLYAQTLDESVDIIGVAFGYDLLCEAPCFTAEDRLRIETGYLREVCRTIQRNDSGISNWQTWHNAGVAAVGFCLDDPALISWAINGKSGLRFQLKNSILPDGFWYEGTTGYHFYALDALRYTVEAAWHAGLDFYSDPAYQSLYDAPMQYTFPDGSFPAINDSSRMHISGQHRLYEIAYSRLKNPNYAWVAGFGKRNSREAFLWGAEELPAVTAPQLGSKNFTGLGAAVLRVGEGPEAAYVHFDYGPHGGGHGHPDKLAVALYALGQEIAPDPGCLAYAAALHGTWYRQTFAHNTIVVDQKSQAPTEGKCELFAGWPDAAAASASSDQAYPKVSLWRTVLLTPTYLLDLHAARSEQSHTYDYLWHNLGEMKPAMPLTPRTEPLGTGAGYQHFTDVQTGQGEQDWSVDFQTANGLTRLTMLGAPGTELFFGKGLTGRPPAPCPMLVARRQGNQALFVSVVNFASGQPDVTGLAMLPVTLDGRAARHEQALAVRVTRGEAEDLFLVAAGPGEKRFADVTTTSRLYFLTRVNGKTVSLRQLD